MNQQQIDILKRTIAREKAARKQAEKILEHKSTELYEVTLKLKESNAKLERLISEKTTELNGVFENIIDTYVAMDLWGNILKMNGAAIKFLGFDNTKDDINLNELVHPSEKKRVQEYFKKLLAKGILANFKVKIITKGGVERFVHINASLIYDNDGIPIAAQGIVRDITQSNQISKLIKEQKKELDIIVENSSIGIILIQSGKIVKTNKFIQKSLGYTKQELYLLEEKDISVKEDLSKTKKLIAKMEAGKIDDFTVEKRYKRKDNSFFWSKTIVNAVKDELGNIIFKVVLVEDITLERQKSLVIKMINDVAKAILGNMDIYEIALEIINQIAVYLNSKNSAIYFVDNVNNTLEKIAFNTQKRSVKKITLPIGDGIVAHVVKTNKPKIIKGTRNREKAKVLDREKEFSKIAVPVAHNSKVIAVIASEHELSNYFTKEHVNTLSSIANLVSLQLNSALNLRELRAAQKINADLLIKLEKSNNELQEYAHIVSHDLKSPLRSIYALTNWIQEDEKGKLSEPSHNNFKLIENTLQKMEQLISNVLSYSILGADIHKKPVNLSELVNELIKILYVPKHISINILTTLPTLKGDKTKLQQLFQNLINNAIKFNDKEKGIINIDVIDQDNYYCFSIQDNGIGIEKKHHSTIFKTFHFLNKNEDSSGIGLSIVKKIVDLHQGDIWLKSEKNKGTTFYFTLAKK
ncbi:PAS domain S-box protein [Tenacibaculum sp. UWU-22]|uniref:PAS domain S-box protein n=1 Tax=Tenacibaculum sp. UWU-22 TaxID=3234187 RepID=UPI0034DB61D8